MSSAKQQNQQHQNSDDDTLSIIDVFEFDDDTADDRWLCSLNNRSRKNSIENEKYRDLKAWLHADTTSDLETDTSDVRKSLIDTRTFTRIKRTSTFNKEVSTVSPETSTFYLSNVWKNNTIQESNEQTIHNLSNKNNNKNYNKNNNNIINNGKIQNDWRDSIPMMLRPKTNQILSTLQYESSPSSINSHTSMEAFMSIANKKDGNNFLLDDQDINSVLMNESQPSLLYSSIISDIKNEESSIQPAINNGDGSLIDSQILTDSMMDASMFKEEQSEDLKQFLNQNSNEFNHIQVQSFDSNDKTLVEDELFFNTSDNKESNATFVANCNFKLNDTYTADSSSSTKEQVESSVNNLRIATTPTMNLTHTIISPCSSLNTTQILSSPNEKKTDLTFTQIEQNMDATFITCKNNHQISPVKESNAMTLNTTFNVIPPLRKELLKEVKKSCEEKLNKNLTKKLDVNDDDDDDDDNCIEPLNKINIHDVPSNHKIESQSNKSSLNTTYDTMTLASKLENSINITGTLNYRNLVDTQYLVDANRFNTFKKSNNKIVSNQLSSQAPQVQEKCTMPPPQLPPQSHIRVPKDNNSCQLKYRTFSKKPSFSVNHYKKSEIKTNDVKKDAEFAKSQQIPLPRQLSKLPQLFQKSNPNLGSNIKQPRDNTRLSIVTGFCKGSQPNISTNAVPSSSSLGKFKSERLLRKTSTESSIGGGISQSTESIDSNKSAHSAPDGFDDERNCNSVASNDSKRTSSYAIKPKNFSFVKKLGGNQEDKINNKLNSTFSKLSSKDKMWDKNKDLLPSPILKNEISKTALEECSSRSSTPTEFKLKTSSPLTNISSDSDQTINTISDNGIEATKENLQANVNVKYKQQIKAPSTTTTKVSMLRRPSNYTGPTSGIPRPSASRIPAPRFTAAKPNHK